MIFKVSCIRKGIESIMISAVCTIIIYLANQNFRNYIPIAFSIIFSIIFFMLLITKDKYIIEKGILTVSESGVKKDININDIIFIEHYTYIGTAGYFNGDGIQEEYAIVTRNLKYSIDERLRNNNGKSLIYILKHSYHKKIKEFSG